MRERIAIVYRPDIDGLRALAVLSVFLFHLNSAWLPGGYTGVDVFFVISGFLITRILWIDIEFGKFSLRNFYLRRIKRILPVFYAFSLASVFVGFILLLPQDFNNLLVSIQRAVLFSANLYFAQSAGYFDITADEKPMLHMWSLSIEEQYYFIWPLALLSLSFLFRNLLNLRVSRRKWIIILITALLVVCGFVYAQNVLNKNAGDARFYFLLQTRFCELLIGSLTALLPISNNTIIKRVFAYSGALLTLFGLFELSKESVFPGYNALLPCLGAALVIYSGQGTKTSNMWVHRLLSLKCLVWIGLISYSLYLWHWSILAYMRYVYGVYLLPFRWMILAVGLSFLFAFLSYRYLEHKFRAADWTFNRAFLGAFLLPAIFILILTWVLQKVGSAEVPAPELLSYGEDVCHGRIQSRCLRGAPSVKPSVLVTGDSHAAMLNEFIDIIGKHEGWAANVVTASSCSPVFGLDVSRIPLTVRQPCRELIDYVRNHYRGYDAVFLSSYWAFQLGMLQVKADSNYLEKLEATLSQIAKTTPVYVFSDISKLSVHPFRQEYFKKLGLSFQRRVPQDSIAANFIVKSIANKIPNAHWIDLSSELSIFDQDGSVDGKPAFFDEHHLNIYGARLVGEAFVKSGRQLRK
ncbi:MAG: acyltransferase [Bdellovibrio sp.]|nr:acyltransferase [Bdellovibrio sp.]